MKRLVITLTIVMVVSFFGAALIELWQSGDEQLATVIGAGVILLIVLGLTRERKGE